MTRNPAYVGILFFYNISPKERIGTMTTVVYRQRKISQNHGKILNDFNNILYRIARAARKGNGRRHVERLLIRKAQLEMVITQNELCARVPKHLQHYFGAMVIPSIV